MAEDQNDSKNISVSVPMGAIATAVVLGLAAAAYVMMGRESEADTESSPRSKAGSMRKRLGLMTLITLLENDASRKVVIAVLRAMARRS